MKKLFVFLLPVLWILSSCDNYGKKIAFGENEVFYKGNGVTEAQAQSLGKYLEKQEFFDKKTPKSVQLTKDEDDYLVHFVVDEKKMTDASRLSWWKLQYDISEAVFGGKTTRIALANDKLEDKEVLNPIALYAVGRSNLFYDNSEIKKADVKKLADFFTGINLLGEEKESDIFYQKKEGIPVVRVVVDPKKISTQVLPVFSYWQELMQEKVFDGKKATMILTNTTYEDMQPLPKLTDEQRELYKN